MKQILLKKNTKAFNETIQLASSKSESNRALIINALCGFNGELLNLSSARDTQTMIKLLESKDSIADVIDAGTTMRFLTAYFTATNQSKLMTGTARMCERPIGILVEALSKLGGQVEYLDKEGYPRLLIKGLKEQKTAQLTMRGDVSSQYISAILMIAPYLPYGLILKLEGEVGSIPYIQMTISQMEAFGVSVRADWDEKILKVAPQKYKPITYRIESDWSGASYWYSVLALDKNPNSTIKLLGLKEKSLQGDSAIVDIMSQLGVKSEFQEDGVFLTKIPAESSLEWDFTNCPDLCQTVSVTVAALGIEATFTGIESLKIKETDRVYAIQTELAKINAKMEEVETNHKYVVKSAFDLSSFDKTIVIETYEDHRMAMAFAPLAMLINLKINDPDVVVKSYPEFWDDLAKVVTIA
ncbi:3-phosphoshikimate 1-carboxyvinyltransferase [Spirosomataceae bacterium TFI 002]|nr:3-phosphoshikimate 1-carboxyvinyltransferase [Spirosomataceae bacterium TFI 002]